jgi:hypothetical protein
VKPYLFCIFFCCAIGAHAQYYNTGTESGSVKWREIKTDRFTIIYPRDIDSIAQRYAWLFEHSHQAVADPLQARLKHTPVVLHPYNIYSNGVVVWAPRRMELFTTPPTSFYPQMWDKQLVLHETRHVAQMNKMNTHVFKVLHYLIGEQSESIAAGVFFYAWFMEGDATLSETAASRTGRGRQAEFLMPVKAFLLNGNKFSWDMWINGSFRYNMPNEYQVGYVLSSYAYKAAGKYIFGHMMDYTTRYPLKLPPASYGLKKYGGFHEGDLYRQSYAYMKQLWEQEDSLKTLTESTPLLAFPKGERYRSYRSVAAVDSQHMVALRTDLAKPARLVMIHTDGHEKHLQYTGAINSPVKTHGRYLYYTAPEPHERWEQTSFSVLKRVDPATRKIKRLTSRTRYFSPAPAPNGQWMAVVENTAKGENFITLLDTDKYKPRRRIAVPAGRVLKELCWSADNRQIYCTVLSDEGTGLQRLDLQTETWEVLLPYSITGINRPTAYKEYLLFESGYNATNNIYAFHTRSRKVFQVTDVRFGAFDPAVSADSASLLFANYTVQGYVPASLPMDESRWKETAFNTPARYALADTASALVGFNIDTLHIPATPMYRSKKYSRWAHLFKVHSWAPFYYNPDELMNLSLDKDILEQVRLGATILSQNILGTATARLGYKYSQGFHSGHFKFTYRGWYPVVDFNVDFNERYRTRHMVDYWRGTYVIETLKQPHFDIYLRVYVPFNFSRNGWQTGLIPQADYHFSNDAYLPFLGDRYVFLQYLRAGVTFYRQQLLGVRDIFPRWGVSFRAMRSFPVASSSAVLHTINSVQAALYTPGLAANHGLLLSAGYQWQDQTDGFKYGTFNHLSLPRGYQALLSQKVVTASVDYTLPVWYPDINLAWVIFIKRFRITAFGDFARVWRGAQEQNLASTGADLLMDYHIFRFGAPISTGIRYAQPLIDNNGPTVSLLFNISI